MSSVCPNCGCDLELLRSFTLGPLSVFNGAIVKWKDRRVRFTPAERLIVLALARAGGATIRRTVLAEVAGYEGDQPESLTSVWLCKINKRFRKVDPSFAAIETLRGVGVRWAVE